MSSYIPKVEEIDRKWYILDAAGKPLGRVSTVAATLLRGKHKPTFMPHVDCGDHVIIINADKAVLTGNKLQKKSRFYHTGWIGHLREIKYKDLMKNNPEKAFEYAIKGMLPSNTIGANSMTRLRVYKGSEQPHAAQKPEVYEF